MTNILTTLNAGSGIDLKALVDGLVEAERTPRQQLLDNRQARVDARISAMGQFRSALDALTGALSTRISSGSLSGIPRVSDPDILTLQVDGGATVPRQLIEVRQLARVQSLASASLADAEAPVGQGTLTIRFGTVAGTDAATGFTAGSIANLSVSIGPGDDSLAGLKNAINDAAAVAGAPIQAQVLSDAGGSRLVLRGAMGEASGFIIETAGDPALEAFAFNDMTAGGMTRTQTAADALVAVDGLELRRPSNSIADLVPGARIALGRAEPGRIVTIEAERDGEALSQVVRDIAGALNELLSIGRGLSGGQSATSAAGALVSDSMTRRTLQTLGAITGRDLVAPDGDAPVRLSGIGLTVDRNGNFTVDEARLAAAVASHPESVEKLISALNAPAAPGKAGGPLRQVAESFRLAAQGAAGQPTALQREAATIAREREQLESRTQRLRDNYTRQFAALDRAVGQSRAVQTFLSQQIDLWTRSSDR